MTAGAGAGAALWVGEIYLLGISHGLPLRSESLFAWSVGAAVGGLATLPAGALLSRTPIFASRRLSAVPIGLATLIVLAFAHQRYLPGSMEPASLAATAAIAAIAVGVWWIVGEPVGRVLGGQVGATLLFISLFIALVAVDRRGAGKISLWVPKAPETIAAAPYTRLGTRQLENDVAAREVDRGNRAIKGYGDISGSPENECAVAIENFFAFGAHDVYWVRDRNPGC